MGDPLLDALIGLVVAHMWPTSGALIASAVSSVIGNGMCVYYWRRQRFLLALAWPLVLWLPIYLAVRRAAEALGAGPW